MNAEFQKAEPGARRRMIKWLVVVAICGGVLLLLAEPIARRVVVWAAGDPDGYIERVGLVLAAIVLLTILPVAGVVLYLLNLARRVTTAERYPPPGHTVAVDTRVLRGPHAVMRARLMRFLAFLLVICVLTVLWLLASLWMSLAGSGAAAIA